MRSGVYGWGERRQPGCVARADLQPRAPARPAAVERVRGAPGGGHPGEQQRERERQPDRAQVGERLHDESVRVFDFQRTVR